MKKILSIILTMAVILAAIPFSTVSAFEEEAEYTEGYYTYVVANGDATITAVDTSISGDITIPSEFGGYPLTCINYMAFMDCNSLTSVIIPDNVVKIGWSAFSNCTSLTSITLGKSVASIEGGAFSGCTSLTSITVNSNNNYYSEDGILFNKAKTELICYPAGKTDSSYTVPDSIESIGESAFEFCESLTDITIPDSVASIGNDAFYRCESLTEVNISDIAAWCNIDFDGYYANPISSAEKLYLNDTLVTDLVIPNNVTEIKDYAFNYLDSLSSVIIGENVKSIGNCAFVSCSSLESITIPDSLTSIGYNAFSGCSSLTAFLIPNSVTSIGTYAFESCTSLTTIIMSENIINIGPNAFLNTPWYDNQPDGIIYINKIAYEYKGEYPEVIVIKDGTLVINDDLFSNFDELVTVTIPDSVIRIGEGAFRWCDSLTEVNISDISAWCNIDFDGYYANPISSAEKLYLNDTLVTDLVIPNNVTEIKDYAFNCLDSLTSVIIPESVTKIGKSAFSECGSLISVNIPKSVTKIGKSAFSECGSLISVNIPESVTSIGAYSFLNCNSLTTVSIEGNTTISCGAFDKCTSLENVYFMASKRVGERINIQEYNEFLTDATWYYNSCIASAEHSMDNDECTKCGYIEYIIGDCNADSDVNTTDLANMKLFLAGISKLASSGKLGADIDENGDVNTTDLAMLKLKLAGIPQCNTLGHTFSEGICTECNHKENDFGEFDAYVNGVGYKLGQDLTVDIILKTEDTYISVCPCFTQYIKVDNKWIPCADGLETDDIWGEEPTLQSYKGAGSDYGFWRWMDTYYGTFDFSEGLVIIRIKYKVSQKGEFEFRIRDGEDEEQNNNKYSDSLYVEVYADS